MTDTAVQCPASGCLVDFPVPLHIIELPCPSCGLRVHLGGTPSAPRYAIHNEPTDAERLLDLTGELMGMSVGDGLQRYVFGDAPDMRPGVYDDRDAVQREVDRGDDHMTIGWLSEESRDEWHIARIDPWEAGEHDDRYPSAPERGKR